MKKGQKNLIGGGILLLTAIGLGAYYYLQPKDKEANSNLNNAGAAKNMIPNIPTAPKDKAVFSTNSGYQVFGTGLIIQFGYSSKYVRFPIPFPNTCISAVASTNRGNAGSLGFNHVTDVTNRGMTAVLDGKLGYWMAMGY
jgi:hypothetical protein